MEEQFLKMVEKGRSLLCPHEPGRERSIDGIKGKEVWKGKVVGCAVVNKVEETRQNVEILNTRSGREDMSCNLEPHLNSEEWEQPTSLPPWIHKQKRKQTL